MRILMATTLATSMALSTGCTTNPQTGETQVSKAAIGALIGAAGGAAIDRKKRGRGAAIGAVLGAGVGYYMQKQEEELRRKMQGSGVGVERDPQTGGIDLIMPGNITFAFNSSNISNRFTPTLNNVANSLNQYHKTNIVVKGYTDNVGSASYNQKLSEQRAYSVANYLANHGVSSNRILTRGYGMSNPVASNNSEAGRKLNRRVEISILPPDQV